MVLIRDALADDCADLAAVQVTSYRTAYAGILPEDYLGQFSLDEQTQDWRELILQPGETIIQVAIGDHAAIVGYALSQLRPDGEALGTGEIAALHVLPEYQRQGVGRMLLNAAAQRLQQEGCSSLVIWVLERNALARRFYERLGGIQDGVKSFAIDDREFVEVAYRWPAIERLCGRE